MSFTVFTDTPANLSAKTAKKYNINIIPFSYFKDGEEYICERFEELDSDAYYEDLKAGAKITTSQINPQRYIDFMEPHVSAGEDILYISLSSGVSGSYASSLVAAAYLTDKYPGRRVEAFDSMGASLGEGLQALQAAVLRERGLSLDETVHELKLYRDRMCQVFTVDNLMFLKRSGRLSGISAVVGTVLGIKPILKGNEVGKIVNFTSVRGRRNAIKALVDRYREYAVIPAGQIVGISYAGCRRDAELLRDMVMEVCEPREIMIVPHEPVTGSHVGPGMLALFFEGGDGVRLKN